MLLIDQQGQVVNKYVKVQRYSSIERGPMDSISGIVVHQTDGPTAESAFNSYRASTKGAHFLIDKDGIIYQTASIYKRANHVGKLKSRCVLESRCSPADQRLYARWNPPVMSRREHAKDAPDRFPSNADSIGIELVGQAFPLPAPGVKEEDRKYEQVTAAQNQSLKWLISELSLTLNLSPTEIFRHPVLSYKNKTEAGTAQW